MKKKIYHILSVFVLLNIHFSCISTEEINYLQDIATEYTLEPYKEYKLNVGDYITCSISTGDEEFASTFGSLITENPLLGRTFLIYEEGQIILPFFGEVNIKGLTIQEAEIKVQELMRESVLDAHVRIALISNQFYMLSGNDKRGSYMVYKENLTIYQALAISGQTTETMDLSKVQIIRKGLNGRSTVKTFDLRTKDVIQSEFYYVYPNDIIYFPRNKNAFFNMTSLGSFISTITVPVTFLIFVSTYDFNR